MSGASKDSVTSDATRDASVDPPTISRRTVELSGRYVVGELLGAGGMGRVYAARDRELNRTVAVKLLPSTLAHERDRLRLLREALAMARLSHPNVVQVHDAGVHDDEVFIVMEQVVGQTLRARLAREIAWADLVDLYVAAGQGLAAAHDAGLVHRDFKPSNVLLGEDGRVRVADFGLAADSNEGGETRELGFERVSLPGSITQKGAIVGTPRYMAPEQHSGAPTSAATDQFSFCVALYEGLFGNHPFGCGEVDDWRDSVLAGKVRAPATPVGPSMLRRAIVRGLAVSPGDRHPSMAALLDALRRARAWSSRVRRRVVLAGLMASGVGLSTWWTYREPCAGAAALVAETWNASRSERVRTALKDFEPATREAALDGLDGYARLWTEQRRSACMAARDGALTVLSHQRIDRCLVRRLSSLDATATIIEERASELGDSALDAVSRLPPIQRCADDAALKQAVDPPAAAIEPDVRALRDDLARVEAVHAAGALESANARLATLTAQADALGYRPVQAELFLATARMAMDRMDWSHALLALGNAEVIGLEVDADLLAAEAAARRIFVQTMVSGPDSLTEHEVTVARAMVARAGAPAWLEALVENNIGVRHAIAGDPAAADAAFENVLALTEDADGVLAVDRAGYLVNVALRTADPALRDQRFEEASAISRRALGPAHARSLEIALLRAQALEDEAGVAAHLGPVCERYLLRGAPDWNRCYLCFWQLAEVGDEEAVHSAGRCLDTASTEERSREQWRTRRFMADALLALDGNDPAAALEAVEGARNVLATIPPAPWLDYERATIAVLEAKARPDSTDEGLIERLEAAASVFRSRLKTSFDQTPARRLSIVEDELSRRGRHQGE